jgi:hypothetical protein
MPRLPKSGWRSSPQTWYVPPLIFVGVYADGCRTLSITLVPVPVSTSMRTRRSWRSSRMFVVVSFVMRR